MSRPSITPFRPRLESLERRETPSISPINSSNSVYVQAKGQLNNWVVYDFNFGITYDNGPTVPGNGGYGYYAFGNWYWGDSQGQLSITNAYADSSLSQTLAAGTPQTQEGTISMLTHNRTYNKSTSQLKSIAYSRSRQTWHYEFQSPSSFNFSFAADGQTYAFPDSFTPPPAVMTLTHVDTGAIWTWQLDGGVAAHQVVPAGSYRFDVVQDVAYHAIAQGGAGPLPAAQDRLTNVSWRLKSINDVIGFDVNRGQLQRSYLRYLDVYFENDSTLDDLAAGDGVTLTRFDLDGSGQGENVSLAGRMAHAPGGRLKFDFGVNGLGGRNSRMGDGYYVLSLDSDGDGILETQRSFYRLFGDTNSDRIVDAKDIDAIYAMYVAGGYWAELDINGDGAVNEVDYLKAASREGRHLAAHLPIDD